MADTPDFLIIGLTEPEASDSSVEAGKITEYLLSGALDFMHIRKPEADSEYTLSLIEKVPQNLYPRLVLHSHYNLLSRFTPGGIHYKNQEDSYGAVSSAGKAGLFITRSCHSLKEFAKSEPGFFYSFLSPVFNSISKTGYSSKFSIDDPALIVTNSNNKIIALGGVIPEYFDKLYHAKFAGAALLGYLWSRKTGFDEKIRNLIESRNNITKS